MLSTYKLLYQIPTPIIAGGDLTVIPVELMNSSAGDAGYTNALATVEVTGPEGSNPVITATDGFFALGFSLPASYDDTINIAIQFDKAGSYAIKIKLVDKNNSDAIICETDKTVIVDSSQAEADARIAVEKAESTKLQSDVDTAQTLVTALSDGTKKTNLTSRLNVVQGEINAVVELNAATTAVTTAETSKLQADVDSARTLVSALPDSTDKTNLTGRLDLIQTEINNANAVIAEIQAATTAVEKAEASKLQADVNSAKSLVSALPDGSDKTSLTNRLDVVQTAIDNATIAYQTQLADATAAVTTAENSKSQADVDTARTLVNALVDGTDKTSLTNRLDLVQSSINLNSSQALANATAAVEKAETSSIQADVDSARTLVSALPTSSQKTSLTSRLDNVQATIDAINEAELKVTTARNAVLLAESTRVQSEGKINLDDARVKVALLPDGTDKTNFTSRLDAVELFVTATTAVAKCESTKLQADTTAAQTLVDALPSSAERGSLRDRINVIQTEINNAIAAELAQKIANATAAVEKAESTDLQSDVDAARTLTNILPDSSTKDNLMTRLDTVQNQINQGAQYTQKLAEATTAVEKAETSKLQVDVDAARTLVNALINDSNKMSLVDRLEVIQKALNIIMITNLVVKAENSKLQADVNEAKRLADLLHECTEKTDLLARIAIVQTEINNTAYQTQLTAATTAVTTAENSKLQADLDSAQTLVTALPDGTDKTDLQTRLTALQTNINNAAYQAEVNTATAEVEKAEASKLQADLDSAKTLVDALPTGSDKTGLQSRLTTLQTVINNAAYQAEVDAVTVFVVTAETSKLQSDLDTARTKVATLPDGTDKTSLDSRLDSVQNAINNANYQAEVNTATAAVVVAEGSKLQADVNSARTLVNALSYDANKSVLLARLDAVQNGINLTVATTAVEKAEASKAQVDIDSAKSLVNALPNGTDKTSLTNRLDVVQNALILTTITNSVVTAESTKLQSDLDSARTKVATLSDGTDKTNLTNRLDAVQAIINATIAVVKCESTKLQADVDAAQTLVIALADSSDKTNLQFRITAVVSYNLAQQNAISAIDAYELTMQAFSAGDIDAFKAAYANLDSKRAEAFAAFSALPEGDEKKALENRYYVAEGKQYSAYKMTLLGFAGSNELQPVKIENIGGTSPYKVTFKGVLPGSATSAYMFYPDDYLATQYNNPLYPRDMPSDILSQTPAGSDSVTLSNQYIKGGQFLIVYEVSGTWYKFVFVVNDAGNTITEVNKQTVSSISAQGNTWTVSKQLLIDKINECNTAITAHEIGLNIGEVTQEAHDTFATAIANAVTMRDTTDLLDINQINSAVDTLNAAKLAFLATANLINRETITDSINEANTLIAGTTVGDQVGQVTQDAMDNLKTEVAKAVIVRNDVSAAQSVIDAEETALIAAINNFKANIFTAANFADIKMKAYETAAQDFLAQVLAKKKI